MRYDDEVLRKINNEANLLEYIRNQDIELERRGKNYYAHCTRHVDNTPSLCFSPENNSFCCFSCGAKGKMIGYLMTYEQMEFEDAVKKAARIGSVDMSKMCHSKTISFLKKYRTIISLKPKTISHQILPIESIEKFHKEPAQEWLDEGITQETMKLFGIRIDEISNRIVYPVYDLGGNLINVKGRTRYQNYRTIGLQKYINYYKVGTMDYFQCLDKTLQYAQESDELIIFESIKSVMKAYGWGYRNCASAEKHTLTDEQIFLLVKLGLNVTFAYDSDISYYSPDVKRNIDKLKKVTNVFIIQDRKKLLGGAEAKNAPVDCGKDIWEQLYRQKRKVS